MYSEAEIESAVAAGNLTPEAAAALRAHVSGIRSAPGADEEQFRLVTGFNDIFVAIAGILVLVGAGWLGGSVAPWLAGVAVAAAAWGMAEYFTLQRRMALPSIIFVLAFVGGLYLGGLALYPYLAGPYESVGIPQYPGFWGVFAGAGGSRSFLLVQAASAAIVVVACWAHWRRFAVPITIALGVGAIARLVFTLIAVAAYPNLGQWLLGVVLIGGLAIFAYAMWWDMQDRARLTRRSDVAFWLHLAASPLIVHPIFMLIGINLVAMHGAGTDTGHATLAAVLALIVYAALAVVALAVDRRAILVSALAYVLVAAIYLISRIGASGAGFAVAIIVIGSSLLMLSAFWQSMRRALLPLLPASISARVPLAAEVSPRRPS
ncbi:hypothetical protein [Sphingomonas bacterium]|uniref:hypothetical protein n=1 Tax=Sphingomonas bacterium TaxID=1895847 RepID=UPI001576DF32|nr:hypothetical protein [Sphingomonas bacterium]